MAKSNPGFYIEEDNRDKILMLLKDAVTKALEEIGLVAEGNAKVNITRKGAVDTGNLRDSITHIVKPSEQMVYIGTPVEYAPYVELGTGIYTPGGRQSPWAWEDDEGNVHFTHGMKPRPFLKPAIVNHMKEYEEIIRSNLEEG